MKNDPSIFAALAALILGLLVGCGGGGAQPAAGPPYRPVSTLEQVMHDVIFPNADAVWKSVGTIITLEETTEIAPADENEWVALEGHARTLMEAGNLLMMGDRPKDQDEFMKRALALMDASAKVLEAAKARDADLVFDRGELIYNACLECHAKYRGEDESDADEAH